MAQRAKGKNAHRIREKGRNFTSGLNHSLLTLQIDFFFAKIAKLFKNPKFNFKL
jgi:hypothetical protein